MALLLIPGPTVLLVVSCAISQGKHVARATVAGVALRGLIAMTASLAGLNALVDAMLAGHLRSYIARPAVLTWFSRVSGPTLIALGVITATARRGP